MTNLMPCSQTQSTMSRLSICIVLIAALFVISTLSVVYAAPAQKEPNKATSKTVASSPDAQSSKEGTMDEPAPSANPTDGPPSEITTSKKVAYVNKFDCNSHKKVVGNSYFSVRLAVVRKP